MSLQATIKTDDQVFKALDLQSIKRLICNTNKGALELVIRKGETVYFLTLDSVPLPKDINKELMTLLFPVKEMEVPQVNKYAEYAESGTLNIKKLVPLEGSKNKGGRPRGSKNK